MPALTMPFTMAPTPLPPKSAPRAKITRESPRRRPESTRLAAVPARERPVSAPVLRRKSTGATLPVRRAGRIAPAMQVGQDTANARGAASAPTSKAGGSNDPRPPEKPSAASASNAGTSADERGREASEPAADPMAEARPATESAETRTWMSVAPARRHWAKVEWQRLTVADPTAVSANRAISATSA